MANSRVPKKDTTDVRAKSSQKKVRGGATAIKRETYQSLAEKLGISPLKA